MSFVIHGARCAIGPEDAIQASIEVTAGRITRIGNVSKAGGAQIDLSGFLVMPGLINAHDHLHFSLFPRLGNPPYQNYIEWGKDIHAAFANLIALQKTVPRNVRLWWGGIRNLLCGVTTVCHHDPLWPELLQSNFPVHVLQRYGWAHSPAQGGNLRNLRSATLADDPFILHACEGVDEVSRMELWQLDREHLLEAHTILVHALALDSEGAALILRRGVSVILCPSSNYFLFGRIPNISLLPSNDNLALGSDSPLTAVGDLLDEVRFATQACQLSPADVYRMVTTAPALMLRLSNGEGSITESGVADFIAVRDTGDGPANRLQSLSAKDVELVMTRGRVQLASAAILDRLSASSKDGLESLSLNGHHIWLRAPVSTLLEQAEWVLGPGNVPLGGAAIAPLREGLVCYGR